MGDSDSSSSSEDIKPPVSLHKNKGRPTRYDATGGIIAARNRLLKELSGKEDEGSSSDSNSSSGQSDDDKSPQPKRSKASGSGSVSKPSDTKKKDNTPSTKEESMDNFIQRIQTQRTNVERLQFEESRCRTLTIEKTYNIGSTGVLYWMSRDQRVQDNWALIYAQKFALKHKLQLFVCFCLVPKFLDATLRQYAFMLKGLKTVRQELHSLDIPFHLLQGQATVMIPPFLKKYNIGQVVCDFSPLRTPTLWTSQLRNLLQEVHIPLIQVDAHNVIPVWVTSPKEEYAARTIRPKINRNLKTYLTEFPPIVSHPYHHKNSFDDMRMDPFENWDSLVEGLQIDKSIKEVQWAIPGTFEGLKMLKSFLDNRIELYESKRNDPNVNALSNLSPWFHFGQLSAARAVLEVKKSPYKDEANAFIEEAIVRRELSDNYCYYNQDYDNIEGASNWATITLDDHRKDDRAPYVYNLKEFEEARTHDDLWNAAQRQMILEGKMHGFMRMYWAKKILEWSESPEKALEISIYLNDKYNLDGRDPNGYVGCMWSICGLHDQGWKERPIFGKVRYMNYNGCKRKFNVMRFEETFKAPAPKKEQKT